MWSIQADDTRSLADDRSALEFDESSDREFTREGEDSIPKVEELARQEEIFEAVRAGLKMDPEKSKTYSFCLSENLLTILDREINGPTHSNSVRKPS
jgi:hypothetical protein